MTVESGGSGGRSHARAPHVSMSDHSGGKGRASECSALFEASSRVPSARIIRSQTTSRMAAVVEQPAEVVSPPSGRAGETNAVDLCRGES